MDWSGLNLTVLDWSGLDWTRLDSTGLVWTELDWTGLDWTGLDWTGLDWTGLDWTGLDLTGLDLTGLNWTGLVWPKLDWTGSHEYVLWIVFGNRRLFVQCTIFRSPGMHQMNHQKSLYAKHLIQNRYTLHSIENCLTILHHQKKGRMLNTIEQFHIYKAAKTGNHLNDHYTDTHNAIFETVLKLTH
jgi:hypothetical protein